MSRTLTAADRKALIRAASAMEVGHPARRAILNGLFGKTAEKGEVGRKVLEDVLSRAKKLSGVDPTLAKYIMDTGLRDGDRGDDKIPMGKATVSAGKLKPSQTTMRLNKTIGMAIGMLLGKMPLGGDLGAIISKDNHILDGHHRWSAAIAAGGPGVSVGGYKADLKGSDLLRVLNIVTKGMFGGRNGQPGSGNIGKYTPANAKKVLEVFVEKGTDDPDYPIPAAGVKEALIKLGGSVEAGIEKMAENIGKVSKAVPSWAPDRKDMPVIREKELPAVSKVLNTGEVNWNYPLSVKEAQALIRLAAALPVGSEDRKIILAGCEKLPEGPMRDNCEKSKKDGVKPGKGKSKSKGKKDKMPKELLEKFKAKKAAQTIGSGKNGYIAMYKRQKVEVMADSKYEAQQMAAKHFRARKPHDVIVMLAEKGGKQVTHMPMFASKKS